MHLLLFIPLILIQLACEPRKIENTDVIVNDMATPTTQTTDPSDKSGTNDASSAKTLPAKEDDTVLGPTGADNSSPVWTGVEQRLPDFHSVIYYVDYDLSAAVTRVRSKINLVAGPLYSPIFDSLGATLITDEQGRLIGSSLRRAPDSSTQYRVMNLLPNSGLHSVETISQIDVRSHNKNASYARSSFNAPWDMSDWVERGFLERYVPSPMESDLFKATFHIRVMEDKKYLDIDEFELVSNADQVTKKKNEFLLEYSTPINSSSIYVHVFKKRLFNLTKDTFQSRSGNQVPILFYAHKSHGAINWITQIKSALTRLEKLIAPWPHHTVIVRAEPGSNWGMEFRGATFTDKYLIFHELAHSYFGRGVLSANGRSGYIDESIVKWLEDSPADHSNVVDISFLRNRPSYSRQTDTRVYRVGGRYIASLKNKNGWTNSTLDFVRSVYSTYKGQPLTDEEFQRFISEYR